MLGLTVDTYVALVVVLPVAWFLPFAGYDDFALCSLRRRQARGVFTGPFAATVPAVCCHLGGGVDFLAPLCIGTGQGGHVHRDMASIIRCICLALSTDLVNTHRSAPPPPPPPGVLAHKLLFSDLFVETPAGDIHG